MSVSVGPTGEQLAALQLAFPGASAVALPNGTTLITVPGVPLPAGWNQTATRVSFLAPVGYPMAKPDCFWADGTLRLAGGGMPTSANVQPVPGLDTIGLWFSWHVASWNASSDTLLTYVRVIQNRLARPH